MTARRFIEMSGNEELDEQTQALVRQRDIERLNAMVGYCKTTACLRGYILDYFGQAHSERCGNCGNCRGNFTGEDVTERAQMIISCVIRIRRKLGYYVGRTLLVGCLRGSSDARVLSMGLDKLSTYALMRPLTKSEVGELIDWLLMEDYLYLNSAFSTIEPGSRAKEALAPGAKLLMPRRSIPKGEQKRSKHRRDEISMDGVDKELYEALRAVRSDLARREKVPPYIIFSNATLRDMALIAPRNMSEMQLVSGVGQMKAERYGRFFLDAVAEYLRHKKQ